MNAVNNRSYEPIPLKDFKVKSEKEMELISKNHLFNMKSRHTIRDFSNKKVPFSIIKNWLKSGMFCTKWNKFYTVAFFHNIYSVN
jgi:hypothetical protein